MDYHLSAASFHFIIGTVHSADESERRLTAALLDYVRDEDRRAKLRERLAEPHKNMKALNKYADLIERNLVNMLVDSFLWYIIGITKEVMLIKPEILRSGEQIRVEEVLDFGSREELISFLVERKVNGLSYGGIAGIERYVKDALGVELFPSLGVAAAIKVLIEVRNINAHNRGRANRIFLKRISGALAHGYADGDMVKLSIDEIFLLSHCCVDAALQLDRSLVEKFGILTDQIGNRLSETEVTDFELNRMMNAELA